MKTGIKLKKIWFDEQWLEFSIEVYKGNSVFYNSVYFFEYQLEALIKELKVFRNKIDDGQYEIKMERIEPCDYFQASMRFAFGGKLFISTYQQSEYKKFPESEVADEAKIHLVSEPILLDNFIDGLSKIYSGFLDEAFLECI
jgi:hypothetical protein